jgi:DNA end-binding protein Ku
MSARPIANARISFGLVSIPVQIYSASNPSASISFNLLHKTCGSRLKQQYVCPKEEVVVPRDEMVKGYEFEKDQYVLFTAEELKNFEEKSTQSIEVTEFIPAAKVDPIYFDKPYYLGPDEGGSKPYRLLSEVMKETGRVALAKYAARGKQYLVMLRPAGDNLVMQQLLYADEVRSISEVPVDKAQVAESEMKLARMLVKEAAVDTFKPAQYEDEVKKRIQEALDRKVKGKEFSVAPVAEQGGEIVDLMEALKASLGRVKKAGPKAVGPAREAASKKPARAAGGRRNGREAARR